MNRADAIMPDGGVPESKVSVVVLTHNRPGELMVTLEHLHCLPEQPPITVVDNASECPLEDPIRRCFPGVTYLRMPENIGAAARNAGVQRATTPYVALCDDDAWWEPGALCRAAEVFDAFPDLAVIAARIVVGSDGHLDPVCAAMSESPLDSDGLPGPAVLGFLAGSAVYRREAYLAVGGFRRQFMVGGEEELMALDLASAGWHLAYVPKVVQRHHPSPARDPAARRRHVLRNAALVAWLRRPLPAAMRQTAALARLAVTDRAARQALQDMLANVAWLRRERRRLPAEVEKSVRLLEAVRAS